MIILYRPIDFFLWQNIHAHHESDAGAAKTDPGEAERFHPYRTNVARWTEHVNTEVGTSTGWFRIYERTADTETNQTSAEEDKAQVHPRIPRAAD